MAYATYIGHYNSLDGPTVSINVPTDTTFYLKDNLVNKYYSSIGEYQRKFLNFDPAWTFLCCSSSQAAIAQAMGFNVLDLSSVGINSIWFSENNYISISRGSNFISVYHRFVKDGDWTFNNWGLWMNGTSATKMGFSTLEAVNPTTNIGSGNAYPTIGIEHFVNSPSNKFYISNWYCFAAGGNPWLEEPIYDPYSQIPEATQGGGQANYDPFSTDDVGFSNMPEVSAVGTGFISLWCPTEQQMLDLSSYMWNADPLTLDFWRKLIADPLQLVYGLNIIPLDLRSYGIVGDTPEDVVVGAISTGIKMDYLTSQWIELDCGEIDINESMLGSYMDYDPFTRLEIYLPYIGYRPLRTDDFMPGTMKLKYKIDLLTGACVAQISSTKFSYHDDHLDSVIYQFMGNCAAQIPVTATQYADAVRSAITTAAAIGTVALLAGAGAPMLGAEAGTMVMPTAGGSVASAPTALVPVDSALGAADSLFGAQMSIADMAGGHAAAPSPLANMAITHAGASAASNVLNTKPSVERSGAIGGAAGMLSVQTPYLVFTRPRIAAPKDQSKYTGYPSFMTEELGNLVGFTQVEAIHLEDIPCTASELAEIDTLLKSGVIF